MKRTIIFMIIFSTFFSVFLSTGLDEILFGVEATVYNEMGVPNIVWINQLDAEGSAGYDITGKTMSFDGSLGLRFFDNLRISVSASVDTDFSSQTDYKFGVGMKYRFSSDNSGALRFLEAKKEAMSRKIKVVGLFFDYFALNSLLNTGNVGEDSVSTINRSLDEVEIAYMLTQMEAYSSIGGLIPEFVLEFGYVPEPLDPDSVDLAILNYFEINKKREISAYDDGIYAFVRSDSEKLKNVVSGGIGGSFRFDTEKESLTPDTLQEISIRRMKLRYDVICQNIPLLINEINELKKLKNTLSKDYIKGNVDSSRIDDLNREIEDLEKDYVKYITESYKIKFTFAVMRGEK